MTTKPPAYLLKRKMMGQGLSDLPSDNYSLPYSYDEWRWIDALHDLEKKKPQRFLLLMAKERVPETIMPFVREVFERKLGGKGGRPASRYLPTTKALIYERTCAQMREQIDKGRSVKEAAATVAPQWQLTAATLIDIYSGKTGYARALRKKR